MPLYEYQCQSCEHRFEKIRKFSDPPLEICPVCGGPIQKLFSSPAIQFKGSGFYITDYAKKSSSEATQAGGSKDKSAADKSSSDKSDKSSSNPDSAKSDTSSKPDIGSKAGESSTASSTTKTD